MRVAKHPLLIMDSPPVGGGELDRNSPALKRRKMLTPVRYARKSPDMDRELGLGLRSATPSYDSGSRKILFDTPDSGARDESVLSGGRENRARRANTSGGSEDDDCNDRSRRLSSNVNPFCVTNANETYASLESAGSGDVSPQPSELFSSPGTFERRRLSRSDSQLSPLAPSGSGVFSSGLGLGLSSSSRSSSSSVLFNNSNTNVGTPPLAPRGFAATRKPRASGAASGSVLLRFESDKALDAARDAAESGDYSIEPAPSCVQHEMMERPLNSPLGLCNKLLRTCSIGIDVDMLASAQSSSPAPAPMGVGLFAQNRQQQHQQRRRSQDETSPESVLAARRSAGGGAAMEEEEEELVLPPPRAPLAGARQAAGAVHLSPAPSLSPVPADVSRTPLPPGSSWPASSVPHKSRRATYGPEATRGHHHSRQQQQQQPRSRFHEEFEEQAVLGRGTFGVVYKCRNRLDGCLYAVKVTNQQFKGRVDRERVLKEVFALSALCNEEENPHIVRYFGAFVDQGHLYIQTELCDRSLQDMIRERDYPGGLETVAKDMSRQVLEGLARLHKNSLVHLDIKPANIFVKNGVFKVGDLGHACLARITPKQAAAAVVPAAAAAVPPRRPRRQQQQQQQQQQQPTRRPVLQQATLGLAATSPLNKYDEALSGISPVPRHHSPVREGLPAPPPIAPPAARLLAAALQQLSPINDAGAAPHITSTSRTAAMEAAAPHITSISTSRTAAMGAESPSPRRQRYGAEDIEEGDSRYMALEVLIEEYEHLAKGDIFSLGASLYEMALGRPLPTNGLEWHAIRNGQLDRAALERFSPSLRELVSLMLQRDPVRRPSAEALLASGGPGGILRTEFEAKLAREKAAADEYRRQLAKNLAGGPGQDPGRLRRSNTM
jgi:serine/threonine protein kinase